MLGPTDLPFAVVGERCLILEHAPKEKTEGGLWIPDTVKMRYFSGTLLDAGLQARDKLHDAGIEIGDNVRFGQYAGLREAWDRIIEGPHDLAAEKYDWKRSPDEAITGIREAYRCAKTKALRVLDSVIVLNVDDLIGSHELAERFRKKTVTLKLGKTDDGSTQYVLQRSK